MSGPDITVTLNRSRSQAPTARSSTNSASASLSDEEDGVRISPTDSQDYSDREYTDEDYDWIDPSKHEVGPSESASRSSASNQHHIVEPQSRRHTRRGDSHIRLAHRSSRLHRQQHPSSPESVGSHEEHYPSDLPRQRRPYYHWAQQAGGQGHQYAPSYSSQGYPSYASPSTAVPPGQQLIPFNGAPPQYAYPGYPQVAQMNPAANAAGYFPQGHHGTSAPPLAPHMQAHSSTPYGTSDMIHPSTVPGYFPFQPQAYPVPHSVAPSPVYHYQHMYSTTPARQSSPAAPPPLDSSKDDGYAELKQMLMEEKAEREAREAAGKKAEADKIAKAEAEKRIAEEIAAAAAKAAAEATTEAEKKAAEKAAEEASKAADEAAKAKAEADAAIAAAGQPPEERKKPIKFKDAVGRKFSFPFHLCATWEGMEDLIRQAFLHVDIIGPHVAEGHYDLIGPNNEIILPAVWETVIEPDWTVTMHMWPMPEPKPEDEIAAIDVPELPLAGEHHKKKGKGKKRGPFSSDVPPPPPAPPATLVTGGVPDASTGKKKTQKSRISWFSGPPPKAKATKATKKP